MKVNATTLPRNEASDTAAPSCEVRVKFGAGPITGSRLSPPASCACTNAEKTISADARTTAWLITPPPWKSLPLPACGERAGVRVAFTLMKTGLSRLQLAFELVEEAPVRAIGDDLLRARLDKADIMHAQRIESHGILGVVFPPFVVGKLA